MQGSGHPRPSGALRSCGEVPAARMSESSPGGLIAVGALGLAFGMAIMTYAQYRGVLARFAAAALCLLVGCLTLRPRTVFDRTGIHSRTLLRSHDIAWPDSRDDFGIARDARSARRIRSAGPSVHATVRSSAGTVELGGMTTRAITEAGLTTSWRTSSIGSGPGPSSGGWCLPGARRAIGLTGESAVIHLITERDHTPTGRFIRSQSWRRQ